MSKTESKKVARQNRAAQVQASIGAVVACPLCPHVTVENALEILTTALGPNGGHAWWNSTKVVHDRALQLTGDPAWRERALSWIDDFNESHGHGPSWRLFWRAPVLWPADTTVSLLNTVMRQLNEGGYLDGTRTPFGLRRRTELTQTTPELARAG
ncbi:hypothetical protein [Streptomyces sp. NBC_01546]|uniref:hypothetical protein n=1 Tax=Streptomyces sp. NBC_01546 TaxID=2975872 RepID=UPI002F91BEC5